ncbi:MAG: hypothetical protein HY676_04960 [Chloroflexi bacterium]|nr:hypothetical protein [Chloroflexota bacterium]
MKRWLIGALFPLGIAAGLAGWRVWVGAAESRQPLLGLALMALGGILVISSLFVLPRLLR